ITGPTQRTFTLGATQGTWTGPSISYTYQWQHSVGGGITWTNITGATNTSYALGVSDEGTSVRMLVTATNVDGAASKPSAPTPVISPYPPANITAPTVSGTAQRSYVLIATQGIWSGPGNTYALQW